MKPCAYDPEPDVPAARDGDRAAQARIIEHMTGAAKSIAHTYASNFPFLAFDDLVQEGHMAVLRAVKRWRHDRGTKFTTYAFQAIRNRAWIIARRTKILNQLEDRPALGSEDALPPGSINATGGLDQMAAARPRGMGAPEVFAGLGWDRARVLICRLYPLIEGRTVRAWGAVSKMEGLPIARCKELFAEALAMVKEAHGGE